MVSCTGVGDCVITKKTNFNFDSYQGVKKHRYLWAYRNQETLSIKKAFFGFLLTFNS